MPVVLDVSGIMQRATEAGRRGSAGGAFFGGLAEGLDYAQDSQMRREQFAYKKQQAEQEQQAIQAEKDSMFKWIEGSVAAGTLEQADMDEALQRDQRGDQPSAIISDLDDLIDMRYKTSEGVKQLSGYGPQGEMGPPDPHSPHQRIINTYAASEPTDQNLRRATQAMDELFPSPEKVKAKSAKEVIEQKKRERIEQEAAMKPITVWISKDDALDIPKPMFGYDESFLQLIQSEDEDDQKRAKEVLRFWDREWRKRHPEETDPDHLAAWNFAKEHGRWKD